MRKGEFYVVYLDNDRVGIFYNKRIAQTFCEFLSFYDFDNSYITMRKECFI